MIIWIILTLFGEDGDFDTFKNHTFDYDTFESVCVDRHPH